MVDSSLELKCSNCGERFWYSGNKKYPETIECKNCSNPIKIIEDA